jgi:hypothetical protein
MLLFSDDVLRELHDARRSGASHNEIEIWVDDSMSERVDLKLRAIYNIVFRPMLPKESIRIINRHGVSFRDGFRGTI